jgi:hypothetical protein
MQVAPRAAPGTGGREVLLLTNHFPVVVRANTLVLYDMVVHRTAPPTPPTTSSTTGEAASSVTTPAPLGGSPSGWCMTAAEQGRHA